MNAETAFYSAVTPECYDVDNLITKIQIITNGGNVMKYCYKCGAQIDDDAVICPTCGVAQAKKPGNAEDRGGLGWSLLSFVSCILAFLLPIVGWAAAIACFIMYLIWRDTKPKTSKALLWGLIIGALSVVLIIACLWANYSP